MKNNIYKCDEIKLSDYVTPVFASKEYLSSLTKDFGWLSDGKQYISFVRNFVEKQAKSNIPVAANLNIINNLDTLWQESPEARKVINASILLSPLLCIVNVT